MFDFIFQSTEHSLNCHLQILSTSPFISLPNDSKLKQPHVCSKRHQNYSRVSLFLSRHFRSVSLFC